MNTSTASGIDARTQESLTVEQPVGGFQDALTGMCGGAGHLAGKYTD